MCNKKYIFPSLSFNDAHAIRVIAHMYSSLGRSTRRDHPFSATPTWDGSDLLFGPVWGRLKNCFNASRSSTETFFSMFPFLSQLSCALFKKSLKIIYSHSRARADVSLLLACFSPPPPSSQDNYCHSFIAFKRAFVDVLSCLRCVWRYMMPIAWINILTFCLQLVHLQTRF